MFRDKIPVKGIAVTFRDVVLIPGKSPVDPIEVDVSTNVTKGLRINIPLVSSPMDTVTESRLAIALARLGGVGVVHRNMTIDEEFSEVKAVKEAPQYPIRPLYVEPGETAQDALNKARLGNVDALPVVSEGQVVGLVKRSALISSSPNAKVAELASKPITADADLGPGELMNIMVKAGVDSVALVKGGVYVGTVTYYDLSEQVKPPFKPSIGLDGRLMVGAAISPFDLERAVKLSKVADFLVVDVAHVDNEKALASLRRLVKEVGVEVVVGNLGTYEGAVDVLTTVEPVGGLRVGIASGSICTTGVVTGVAAPTLWAVAQVADAAWDYGLRDIPIIADGGIREPGDAVKAFALGAWAVMMGRFFAQSDESPSPIIRIGDRKYKYYRGMASEGARARRFAVDRYGPKVKNVEEGVEGLVPYRGPLADLVREFIGGIQASLGYIGARNIQEAWVKGRVAILTQLGRGEVEPHDIYLG